MRHAYIRTLVSIICLIPFGVVLNAQGNNDRQAILSRLNNLPQIATIDKESIVGQFSPADVPILYDILFDTDNTTVKYRTRELAAHVASFLNPDQSQINRLVQYINMNLPAYNPDLGGRNIVAPIMDSIGDIYRNTNNDDVLEPLRALYEDTKCLDECTKRILQTLQYTDSVKNRSFFNKILRHNDDRDAHKALAVFGLAKTGSLEAIPYLREMAYYLFDTEEIPEHYLNYIASIRTLGELGSKHYEASKEIQQIITKVCIYDTSEYSYMMKTPDNVYDLFNGLKINGGEGNRKYFENLLDDQCKYKNAKVWAIKALGIIGNEGTISILLKYAKYYPEQVNSVNNAITAIQKRISQ
jgi:hypothetical protein